MPFSNGMEIACNAAQIVNDKKVTDHHAAVSYTHLIDYRDIKARVVEQPGHRSMVITRGFHHHTGLAVQACEQSCQLAQFIGCLLYTSRCV